MRARRHSAIRTVNRRAAGLDWKSSGRFGAGDQGLRCPPPWRVNRTGAPARLRTPMAPKGVRLRSSALRQFRLKLAATLRSACTPVAAQKADMPGCPLRGQKSVIAYQPRNRRGRLVNGRSCVSGNVCLLRSAFLNGGRGLANHVDNDIRLGEHRYVAACHFRNGRSHALRGPVL